MTSEKDEKIVAAVFASRGEPEGGIRGGVRDDYTHISECASKGEFFNKGDIIFTGHHLAHSIWQIICTIEEYNQCIEDMARAEWISDYDSESPAYFNYELHKANCEDNGIDTSNNKLLKENCDYSFYDKPLVYTQDDYDYQRPLVDGMQFRKTGSGSRIEVALLVTDCEVCHKNKDDLLVITPIKDVRPIKTPEQIKQDKLDTQALAIKAILICDGHSLELSAIKHILKNFTVEPK